MKKRLCLAAISLFVLALIGGWILLMITHPIIFGIILVIICIMLYFSLRDIGKADYMREGVE